MCERKNYIHPLNQNYYVLVFLVIFAQMGML